MGVPLDFDVDWQVDNLLSNNDAWKSFVADKVGGRYFLQDYVIENKDKIQSGEIPDEMLYPESFNPEFDTRLHKYYSNRIKKAFEMLSTEEEMTNETKKKLNQHKSPLASYDINEKVAKAKNNYGKI